ncbi:DUF1570 domain-containing protein [Singulisphaera sp. PoT]|uniref:DUF1570 domain-containing protein n=1 Tax=Singulisphaera sp. PoT TaxID=3411797 RepID=UPI003BF4992D
MMQETRPDRLLRIVTLCLVLPLATLGIGGCATIGGEQGQALVPTKYRTQTGPYAVYSNFPIPSDAPAIRSLQSLESDIASRLGIHVESEQPPVEVYILNDRQSFAHFLQFYYPDLPPRRAFFIAQGTQRVVFTFMGERLEEDLRHEATHALLNVVYGDLPLWLDEGLAEYFEGPTGRQGVNAEHLAKLPHDLAAGWSPNLANLESLKTVREMTPRDYRESWAWVHYLLNDSKPGSKALFAYLNDLSRDPNAAPLSSRLKGVEPTSPRSLVAHIDQVRAQPLVATPATPRARTVSADSTVRLQDNNTLEPSRTVAPRRGLVAWFKGIFGQ